MKRLAPVQTLITLALLIALLFIIGLIAGCHPQTARGMTSTPIVVATIKPALTAATTPEPVKYYLPLISPRYRAEPIVAGTGIVTPTPAMETR